MPPKDLLETGRLRGDPSRRNLCLGWTVLAARFVSPEWFRIGARTWAAEVRFKPALLALAWGTAVNRAPHQARVAGEVAAQTHQKHAALASERASVQATTPP